MSSPFFCVEKIGYLIFNFIFYFLFLFFIFYFLFFIFYFYFLFGCLIRNILVLRGDFSRERFYVNIDIKLFCKGYTEIFVDTTHKNRYKYKNLCEIVYIGFCKYIDSNIDVKFNIDIVSFQTITT